MLYIFSIYSSNILRTQRKSEKILKNGSKSRKLLKKSLNMFLRCFIVNMPPPLAFSASRFYCMKMD